MFEGFTSGIGIFDALKSIASFKSIILTGFKTLSKLKKLAFVFKTTSYIISAGGSFVLNGFMTKWDINNPALWFGSLNAILGASNVPKFFKSSSKFYARSIVNLYKQLKSKKIVAAVLISAKVIGAVGTTGVSVYLHGDSATGGTWDFKDVSTYDGIINGLTSSKQYIDLAKSGTKFAEFKYKEITSNRMNQIAQRAIDTYNNMNIKSKSSNNLISMNGAQKFKNYLSGADLAVYKTGKLYTIVIKTNTGPDLIIWTNKRGTNIDFLKFNKDGKSVPPNVKLSNNPTINTALHGAIETAQLEIKKQNHQIFDSEIIPKINKIIDDIPIQAEYQTSIIKNKENNFEIMRKIIDKQGFVPLENIEKAISTSFDDAISTNQNQINIMKEHRAKINSVNDWKSTNEVLKKIKSKNIISEHDSDDIKSNKINEAKQSIDHQLDNLNNIDKELKQAQINAVKQVNTKQFDFTEKMENNWLKADPLNSAEINALSARLNAPTKLLHKPNKFYGLMSKLFHSNKMLFSYNIDGNLEIIPKTISNNIIKQHTKIIVNDPSWYDSLQKLKKSDYISFYRPYSESKSRSKRSIDTDCGPNDLQNLNRTYKPNSKKMKLYSLLNTSINTITKFVHNFTKLPDQKSIPLFKHPDQTNNSLSVDGSYLQFNNNLLLLDVITRKFTKQKYVNTNILTDPLEVQVLSMNIIENFENVVHDLYEIDINEFMNIPQLQSKIYNAIMSDDHRQVPSLLKKELLKIFGELNSSDNLYDYYIDDIVHRILSK